MNCSRNSRANIQTHTSWRSLGSDQNTKPHSNRSARWRLKTPPVDRSKWQRDNTPSDAGRTDAVLWFRITPDDARHVAVSQRYRLATETDREGGVRWPRCLRRYFSLRGRCGDSVGRIRTVPQWRMRSLMRQSATQSAPCSTSPDLHWEISQEDAAKVEADLLQHD